MLLRAAEPLEGCLHATRGPGNLCRALRIDAGRHTGLDLEGGAIWIEDGDGPAGRVRAHAPDRGRLRRVLGAPPLALPAARKRLDIRREKFACTRDANGPLQSRE